MQRTRARSGYFSVPSPSSGHPPGSPPRRRRASRSRSMVAHPDQRARLSNWQAMADAYMAENPNVTINITVMENEAYKPAMQTGPATSPTCSSRGGRRAARPGRTPAPCRTSPRHRPVHRRPRPGAAGPFNIDGVQYGLPYNQSIVGIWYNKTSSSRPASRHRRRRGASCSRTSRR